MLIGLCGKKGSGKSTFGDYLSDHYQYSQRSFADCLKKACGELFLLKDEQLYGDIVQKETPDPRWFNCTPRKMLQFVGTDLLRNQINQIIPELGNDIFVHHFQLWYQETKPEKLVVTDIRFQNELDTIIKLGGIVIRIIGKDEYQDDHPSEAGIDQLQNCYNLIINRGSIEDFYRNIDDLLDIVSKSKNNNKSTC